jgi:hydroxypyruvate reductase
MNARRVLLELFDSALRAVDGRACVEELLRHAPRNRSSVFAIGKAACAMALGAKDALGDLIEELFVVTKQGHVDPQLRGAGVTILESAHPVPDARSLAAGAELARRVTELREDLWPIFLISGGSSSLVECLNEGETLESLRALNERGLAAGWEIRKLNQERSRISRLKGGGLTRLLGQREALGLFISDVPGDSPGVIGSGLLGLPGDREDPVTSYVVANIDCAVREVINAGGAHGLELEQRTTRFDGDVNTVANEFLEALRATRADGLVWGGESTVKLPEVHGRGGRNTHLALTIARSLRPGERLQILAAGTDGTDGPTQDAGAIVDALTVERATIAGCDVERAWRDFDSGTALEASEDLVHTGPTGTNVGDILIGLKHSAGALRGDPLPRML